MADACNHAGGPLHEGEIEGGLLTCPWHGPPLRLADSAVVNGPATFPQLRLETRVSGGSIEGRSRQG